jgi:hypothetical protein
MDKSAFQLFKNNLRSNANTRLHETPLISYGRVIKVIDIQTVVVEAIVQTSLSKEVYTVTLINFSSALLEISDYPKLGDTVLLLFLQRYDPRMFVQPIVDNFNATGYNKFSGIGVLMSTVKHFANTVLSFYEENGKPIAELTSSSEVYATFNNSMTTTFCRAVFDSEDEELITMLFGKGRPLIQKFLSRIERSHGFWWDNEDSWEEMDASITEEYSRCAPITRDIQGTQTTSVGLGKDKHGDEGKPVETDAPVKETVHGKSPITKNIRSPQTYTIGIGNEESGDASEQREAPVNVEMGEKSDVVLTSKSALTLHFDKAVLVESGDAYDLVITGAMTLKSNDKISIEASADVAVKGVNVTVEASETLTLKTGDAAPWIVNSLAIDPMTGVPHGGAQVGIIKLKGA